MQFDIVQAVNDPEIKVEDLAAVISRDPRLAMQLLKIVNSPACSLNREVQSIRETIVYLGIAQVQNGPSFSPCWRHRQWHSSLSPDSDSCENNGKLR